MNTTSVPVVDTDTLLEQSLASQANIERIKRLVAKPIDNINHPVPLFEQLEPEREES